MLNLMVRIFTTGLPKGSYYALSIMMLFILTLLRSWRVNNRWDIGNIACVAQGWQHRSQQQQHECVAHCFTKKAKMVHILEHMQHKLCLFLVAMTVRP